MSYLVVTIIAFLAGVLATLVCGAASWFMVTVLTDSRGYKK